MNCFDVVCQPPSPPYTGFLSSQRSLSSSPLKKRCRLDPEAVVIVTSASSSDVIHCKRGGHALKTTTRTTEATKATATTTATGLKVATHASSASFASDLNHSLFPTALTTLSSAPSMTSSSTSPTISSSSVVTLKSEMTSAAAATGDDDIQPVTTQQIGGNSILLTYFTEDIETNIDNHFHRALNLSQQSAAEQRFASRLAAAGSDKKTQISSCCRQNSSPLSHRQLTVSFWNSMSCPTSASPSPSPYTHRPSNRSTAWSPPFLVSPSKTDPLAVAFSLPSDPVDPYVHHLNFPSAAAGAASPTRTLGAIHHPQDSWHAYAFVPPPPPPPPPSTYRRYRHSVHEFSFSEGVPSTSGTTQFGSGMRGYKPFLPGQTGPQVRLDEQKPSNADFWRQRCYGFGEMPTSQLTTGFTLTGGIEVTQDNFPETPVKDVYWF